MQIGQQVRALGFWSWDRVQGAPVRRQLDDIEGLAADPDRRRDVTVERLRDLLRHATATTRHYAPFAGAALRDFPVLQKAEIRARYADFVSSAFAPDRLYSTFTSGSYGTPLRFPLSPEKRARQLAELIYFTGWVGWQVGMRYLQVRARPHSRLHRLLHNEVVVDPTHMTAAWFREGRRLLKDGGIRYVLGYPSAVHALAEHCREQGDGPASFRVLGAALGGETLTPQARSTIEAVLGCPVRSRYAANELGMIAQEPLDQPGRHLFNACTHVHEVLRLASDEPAPPGEVGRLVITDLFSQALPLIRYDTGDLVIDAGAPAPGSALPVLARVEGRHTDVVFDAEGNRMNNLHFFDIFRDVENLVQFQLVQTGARRYLMRCVVLPGFADDAAVVEQARAALGRAAEIAIERVAEIPALASGKRPAILSRMA